MQTQALNRTTAWGITTGILRCASAVKVWCTLIRILSLLEDTMPLNMPQTRPIPLELRPLTPELLPEYFKLLKMTVDYEYIRTYIHICILHAYNHVYTYYVFTYIS